MEGLEGDTAGLLLQPEVNGGEHQVALRQTPKHPLLIEDVLKQVLSYLDFNQLKQCRLVSSLWNLVAIRQLARNCGYLKFGSVNMHLCEYFESVLLIEDMARLLELTTHSGWHFACRKFEIFSDFTSSLEDEQILGLFLEAVSPWITDFKLSQVTHPERHGLFATTRFQPRIFPNLRSVTVQNYLRAPNRRSEQNNLDFLACILRNAPNLKQLCFEGGHHLSDMNDDDTFEDSDVATTTTLVLGAFAQGPSWNIQGLSLSAALKDCHLTRVMESWVNLKELRLHFYPQSCVTAAVLQGFLEHLSNSLETLELWCTTLRALPAVTIELPCLSKLKALKIRTPYHYDPLGVVPQPPISIAGVCYARQLPMLKHLSFWLGDRWNLGDFISSGIEPANTVQVLELSQMLDDPNVAQEAARVFPNVKKLKVACRVDVMNVVYQSFENVEELTLVYGERNFHSVDQVLTGYSVEDCEQIQGLSERLFGVINRGTEPQPFLQRLKVLKILRLETCDNDHETLSDISCRLILLKLRNLKRLELGLRPAQVSRQVVQEMRKHFRILCENRFEDEDSDAEQNDNVEWL